MTERNYTVTCINGYRKTNLTREDAIDHAIQLNSHLRMAGWQGRARVFYRDGSEIALRADAAQYRADWVRERAEREAKRAAESVSESV